jgi:hypothetical protein
MIRFVFELGLGVWGSVLAQCMDLGHDDSLMPWI